jgi:alanine racemase
MRPKEPKSAATAIGPQSSSSAGFLNEEIETIAKNRLSLTLSSLEEARQVQRVARKMNRPISVQVKVDTGMGRLGCQPAAAAGLLDYSSRASHLKLEGFYSHYSCADESKAFTRQQWKRFSDLPSPPGVLRHMCNSAGLLGLPESQGDIVRPGLIIFGISPFPKDQKEFRPALSWKCRVVAVRDVPKGATLSYGATYTAPRPMRIATLAVGYGDGLSRKVGNRGQVLIRGHSCRIRGRVTMDQILVECPPSSNIKKGDTAVLLGTSGKKTILATDMAKIAETIPYEIWCQLTGRVVKCYL